MEIVKCNCPSCGAPLYIEEDMRVIKCQACGSTLSIERSQGEINLTFIERLTSAIQESGYATRKELQRLQTSQAYSTLQLQLSNLQAEMRGLTRNGVTPVVAQQLQGLHRSEYDLHRQMFDLHKQLNDSDPADLPACLRFSNEELAMLDLGLTALEASNCPDKLHLVQELKTQRTGITNQILGLKIRILRKEFASFTQADPATEDRGQIATLLARVDADEGRARQVQTTPEGRAVHAELVTRQQKLRNWLLHIDREKLEGMLRSTHITADPNDLNAQRRLMGLVRQDLGLDFSPFDPGLARSYQSSLLARKNAAEKQIARLERKAQRAESFRLFKGRLAGFWMSGSTGKIVLIGSVAAVLVLCALCCAGLVVLVMTSSQYQSSLTLVMAGVGAGLSR